MHLDYTKATESTTQRAPHKIRNEIGENTLVNERGQIKGWFISLIYFIGWGQ